jgi:hypothetical protein
MNVLVRRLLRVVLVVLLLGTVLAQVLVPVQANDVGTRFPEMAYLVVPYTTAAILFIECGQVALLAVWLLLTLVEGGVIFTRRALGWVDIITACGAIATVLAAAVLVHMLLFVPGGGGPAIYYMTACTAGGLAFTLLMVVMRGLLDTAITDRTELDEVI